MSKFTGYFDKNQKQIFVGSSCYYDDAEIDLDIIEVDGDYYAKPYGKGMEKELLENVAKYIRVID